MIFKTDDIQQVVQNVWETVLRSPVEPGVEHTLPEGKSSAALMTGTIHVKGTWEGTIGLVCSAATARAAAALMFDASGDSLPEGDVRDALGELTNMVGGNLRSLLPEPCQLGLPAVSGGCYLQERHVPLRLTLPFSANGQLFWVALADGIHQP